MTIVDIWLVENKTKKIKVVGHTDYAKSGNDIVCSSISTAVIMSANLISKVCPKYKFISDEKKVLMEISIIEENDITEIIMNNLYQTLLDLSSQYPNNLKVNLN